ncbi:MAG: HAD-IB family hydrolase [Acidimicrobiales bacterium]
MDSWRAGCGGSRKSGSGDGPGRRTCREADTASRSDPTLLAGRDHLGLSSLAREHAAALVTRVRPQMLERLEGHRAGGDRVVIVSASPELYLHAVGEALGVDAVLGTRLEVGADGRLTGALVGRNCRGPEKVSRLKAWISELVGPGGAPPHLCAYGDSAGDAELMALADVATWVGRRR